MTEKNLSRITVLLKERKNSTMYAKKNNSAKLVALVLVLALLIGGVVGGTIAWLVTNTDPVVNTFTVGNINITLTETDAKQGENKATKEFKMVPGTEIGKDPVVTVEGGSEACWLFVEVTESANLKDYIKYSVRTGDSEWTLVDESRNVYGRKVETSADNQAFYVLTGSKTNENGCVTVKSEVTKAMMEALNEENATKPSLTFTAYAIQSENLTKNGTTTAVASAADAWEVYNNPPTASEES